MICVCNIICNKQYCYIYDRQKALKLLSERLSQKPDAPAAAEESWPLLEGEVLPPTHAPKTVAVTITG